MFKTLTRIVVCASLALGALGCGGNSLRGDSNYTSANRYDFPAKSARPIDGNRRSIEFVVDTSGSMDGEVEGKRKIDSAKAVLLEVLQKYNEHNKKKGNLDAGLLYFGSDNRVRCLVPMSPFDYESLRARVSELDQQGSSTPLGTALAYAEREIKSQGSGIPYMIMLTDGENSEGKGPLEIVQKINRTNKENDYNTRLFLVAFDVNASVFSDLRKEGAKVYSAKNASELGEVLEEISGELLEAPAGSY